MALTRGQILVGPIIEDDGAGAYVTFRDTTATPDTVTIAAPNDVTSSYTITLPSAPPPVDGYILSFTTGGVASFAANSPTPGGTVDGAVQYRSSGSTLGSDGVLVGATTLTLPSGSEARFDDTGSNYVAFTGPGAAMTGTVNNTYTLPVEIGSAGQVLKLANVVGTPATSADLIWDNALTGSATAQGNQGVVQLSDGAGGFASTGSGTPYDEDLQFGIVGGTYAQVNKNLNIANTGGLYQINGTTYLSSTQVGPSTGTLALGAGVTTSSLTTVGTLTGLTVNGNVSVNNTISTPTSNNLFLQAGTGASASVVIRQDQSVGTTGAILTLEDGQGTPGTIAFRVPDNINGSLTYTLPASVGATQVKSIQVASNSVMSFVDNRKCINFTVDGGGTTVIQDGLKGFYRVTGSYTVENFYYTQEDNTDTPQITITKAASTGYAGPGTGTNIAQFNASGYITTAIGGGATIADGDILEFNLAGASTGNSVYATITIVLIPTPLT